MQLHVDLLLAYGASTKRLEKGEFIFMEGDEARFFFQIIQGKVKVFCTNDNGKELIHCIFETGDSFGEPPVLLGKPYPSSAICLEDTIILKLFGEKLPHIIKNDADFALRLIYILAKRTYDKSVKSQILISPTPAQKILSFFEKIKAGNADTIIQIPYTRQQIADFTGLRVETVIRTLINLSAQNKVNIINHKVYY